mmetsp:Transcript_40909/g.103053  ORF Transcript_40909/g.103053 Transcript_40909/m.103053 type:complete len:575 (+) Transcript_40909:464-2188(+)
MPQHAVRLEHVEALQRAAVCAAAVQIQLVVQHEHAVVLHGRGPVSHRGVLVPLQRVAVEREQIVVGAKGGRAAVHQEALLDAHAAVPEACLGRCAARVHVHPAERAHVQHAEIVERLAHGGAAEHEQALADHRRAVAAARRRRAAGLRQLLPLAALHQVEPGVVEALCAVVAAEEQHALVVQRRERAGAARCRPRLPFRRLEQRPALRLRLVAEQLGDALVGLTGAHTTEEPHATATARACAHGTWPLRGECAQRCAHLHLALLLHVARAGLAHRVHPGVALAGGGRAEAMLDAAATRHHHRPGVRRELRLVGRAGGGHRQQRGERVLLDRLHVDVGQTHLVHVAVGVLLASLARRVVHPHQEVGEEEHVAILVDRALVLELAVRLHQRLGVAAQARLDAHQTASAVGGTLARVDSVGGLAHLLERLREVAVVRMIRVGVLHQVLQKQHVARDALHRHDEEAGEVDRLAAKAARRLGHEGVELWIGAQPPQRLEAVVVVVDEGLVDAQKVGHLQEDGAQHAGLVVPGAHALGHVHQHGLVELQDDLHLAEDRLDVAAGRAPAGCALHPGVHLRR